MSEGYLLHETHRAVCFGFGYALERIPHVWALSLLVRERLRAGLPEHCTGLLLDYRPMESTLVQYVRGWFLGDCYYCGGDVLVPSLFTVNVPKEPDTRWVSDYEEAAPSLDYETYPVCPECFVGERD